MCVSAHFQSHSRGRQVLVQHAWHLVATNWVCPLRPLKNPLKPICCIHSSTEGQHSKQKEKKKNTQYWFLNSQSVWDGWVIPGADNRWLFFLYSQLPRFAVYLDPVNPDSEHRTQVPACKQCQSWMPGWMTLPSSLPSTVLFIISSWFFKCPACVWFKQDFCVSLESR